MPKTSVHFFNEDVSFTLPQKRKLKGWIISAIKAESKIPGEINFIFCSDEHLLQMNRDFLDHDYYTDIITFDNSENSIVSGELFISVDRARDNASSLAISTLEEIHRLMIHGVLHLCGYKDKKADDKKQMTLKENYYLSLLH